jgi:hypothetical protein
VRGYSNRLRVCRGEKSNAARGPPGGDGFVGTTGQWDRLFSIDEYRRGLSAVPIRSKLKRGLTASSLHNNLAPHPPIHASNSERNACGRSTYCDTFEQRQAVTRLTQKNIVPRLGVHGFADKPVTGLQGSHMALSRHSGEGSDARKYRASPLRLNLCSLVMDSWRA